MQYEEEEGEIVDDDDTGLDVYKPLVRPVERWSLGGCGAEAERSCSDGEEGPECIGPPPRPPHPMAKFNVWQVDESEELCHSLSSCLGTSDRHVESYQYLPPGTFFREALPRQRPEGKDLKNFRGTASKRLAPLAVSLNSSLEEIAKDICKKLHEKNQALIYNVVSVVGGKKAILLYRKTRNIERNGGLLIKNRSRQRTSGGVFLHLLHLDKDLTENQLNQIFQDQDALPRINKNKSKKSKARKNKKDMRAGREVRTPPPSPEAPGPPRSPALPTATLLDRTSALLASANQMQVE